MSATSWSQSANPRTHHHVHGDVEVDMIPSLTDNYIFLLRESGGCAAIVDPAEADPVRKFVRNNANFPSTGGTGTGNGKQGPISYIFNTHHHWDHTGGNEELKKEFGCEIFGASSDRDRIPGIDVEVKEGSHFKFGKEDVQVYETPGHTSGHIIYYLPGAKIAFVGDTLFAMGCGRLFEGTAEQMHKSLQKIVALPPDTHLYFAHEYTVSNAKFAVTVDGGNEDLQSRFKQVTAMRSENIPTVPTTVAQELATNPFVRCSNAKIKETIGMEQSGSDVDSLARIRALKDSFRG